MGEIDGCYFDREDQFQRVRQMLLPGEHLYYVLDCKGRGSGFMGVTDKRLILRDDGRMRLKKQIVSIPYRGIHALGIVDDMNIWGRKTCSVGIQASEDDWELEFKGDKAHDAYRHIMGYMLDLSPVAVTSPDAVAVEASAAS